MANKRLPVLMYATAKRRRYQTLRYLRISIVVLLIALLLEYCVEYGTVDRCCSRCGAFAKTAYLGIWEWRWEWTLKETQNSISNFLNSPNMQSCNHVWNVDYFYRHQLFIPRAEVTTGDSTLRAKWVRYLDSYPDLSDVLEEIQRNDPMFRDRLQEAIKSPETERSRHFLEKLLQQVDEWDTGIGTGAEQLMKPESAALVLKRSKSRRPSKMSFPGCFSVVHAAFRK